jgi:CHAT domain-containing protein/Tfp pilus assembly protein PilF
MRSGSAFLSISTTARPDLEPRGGHPVVRLTARVPRAVRYTLGVILSCVSIAAPAVAQADADQGSPARIWLDRGKMYVTAGKYDSARTCFTRAAVECRAGDEEELIAALTGTATAFVYTGRMDSAESVLRRVVARGAATLRKPGLVLAESYAMMAYIDSYFDRADSALRWNAKSADIRRSILGASHPLLSSNCYNAGMAHAKKGMFAEAVEDFHSALRLIPPGEGSAAQRAQVHSLLGGALRECRQYNEALAHIDTAMTLLRLAGKGSSYDMVMVSTYAAYAHTANGDLTRAIALFDSALTLSRAVCPDNHVLLTAIRASQAQAFLALGDLDRTLEVCGDALVRTKSLGAQNSSGKATIHEYMARAHIERGDTADALLHAREALTLLIPVFGEMHPDVAAAYDVLADIEARTGRNSEAFDHLRDAIRLRRELFSGSGAGILIPSFIDMAHVQTSLGDLLGAEETINGLFATSAAVLAGDPLLSARALSGLGDVRLAQQDPAAAVAVYDSSLQLLLRSVNEGSGPERRELADLAGGKVFLDVLHQKGHALRLLSPPRDPGTALKQAAVETYEAYCLALLSLRSRYVSEASKLRLADGLKEACAGGMQFALELYALTKEQRFLTTACSFADLEKAGMLQEGIRRAKVMRFAGVPEALVDADRTLKVRLTALELDYAALRETPGTAPATLQNLRWNILSLRDESRATSEQLRQLSPAYARLMECDRMPDIGAIQASLDDSTLVLEYFLGRDRATLFMISRNGLASADLGPCQKIEEAAGSFIRALRTLDYDGFAAASRRAYGLLIAPAEKRVARYTRLAIVPEGILSLVPFEALLTGPATTRNGRAAFSRAPFLVRTHEIVVSPSARLLSEPSGNAPHKDPRTWTFAGFAPVFSDSVVAGAMLASNATQPRADEFRAVSVNGRNFRALPFSDREVTGIAGTFLLHGSAARTFVNADASEATFKSIASACTHLHIATHGIMSTEDPSRSSLLFTPSGSPGDDGIFHAAEAYDLDLHADLVVLSSCESGVGKIVDGEGVFALMRGFLHSGARDVMYSLWQIMDRHTSELMQAFYREAVAGVPLPRALQRAKLKMLADERTSFPFSWAGFILVGR